MTPQELMDVLIAKYAFNATSAQVYTETNGFCRYCGEDVFTSFLSYSSSQVDHILPKKKYPSLKNELKNQVLSCFFCNQQKKGYDPLQDFTPATTSDDPYTVLLSHREQLIKTATLHMASELSRKKQLYNEIRSLLRN